MHKGADSCPQQKIPQTLTEKHKSGDKQDDVDKAGEFPLIRPVMEKVAEKHSADYEGQGADEHPAQLKGPYRSGKGPFQSHHRIGRQPQCAEGGTEF